MANADVNRVKKWHLAQLAFGGCLRDSLGKQTAIQKAPLIRGFFYAETRRRPTLPPRLRGSTIGAGGLNFRVRNGNGCLPSAMITWFPSSDPKAPANALSQL